MGRKWIALSSFCILLFCILVQSARARGLRDLQKALGSRDREERAKAVTALAEMPGRTPLLMLLNALTDDDAVVRGRARRGLSGRRSPEDRKTISARGTSHPDPRVRLASFAVLSAAKTGDCDELLARAIRDRDPKVREAAVDWLLTRPGGRGKAELAAAVLRGREGRPRAAALLALAGIDPAAARGLAGKVQFDRAMELRVAALEVIANGPGEEAVPDLVAGLQDPVWSVRLTAIRSLSRIRTPAAVDALIGSLGVERGRLREEQGDALATLTGVGLPPDREKWERWRRENPGEIDFPEHRAVVSEHSGESAATFSSIPFHSECVAFVLDRSRSMRDRLDRENDETKGDLVLLELSRTLARLSPPAKFLLVAFRTEPTAFTKGAVTASSCTRKKALTWFRKLEPTGRTNLFDAVSLALSREEVDTVFLLTDGAPSAGEYQSRGKVIAEIENLNRYRKAAIHTVEIGGEATGKRWRGFLRELAEANGGKHARR